MNEQLWQKAVAFHGHDCPGLAMGVKICEAAWEKLSLNQAAMDEELVCVTENDACPLDAVQALLGCTLGKGNLLLRDRGKMAFSFFNRRNGQKIRIYFKMKKPDGMSRRQWQEAILAASIEEACAFGQPSFALPEPARHFASYTCAKCGEQAAESRMRLQNGEILCGDCYHSYQRGW